MEEEERRILPLMVELIDRLTVAGASEFAHDWEIPPRGVEEILALPVWGDPRFGIRREEGEGLVIDWMQAALQARGVRADLWRGLERTGWRERWDEVSTVGDVVRALAQALRAEKDS